MEIQNKPRIIISFMVEHTSGTQGQLPMNFFTVTVQTAKRSVFQRIRAEVKQKVWNETENRERDWGVFLLQPHMPYGCVRLARFACVRLLRHALPSSLLILRKKPTVLQSSYGEAQLTNVAILSFPAMMTKASPVTADSLIASSVNTVTL